MYQFGGCAGADKFYFLLCPALKQVKCLQRKRLVRLKNVFRLIANLRHPRAVIYLINIHQVV